MKLEEMKQVLSEQDFHIDPLGRMVIDNPEILAQINGAMMQGHHGEDPFVNAGCSNVKC